MVLSKAQMPLEEEAPMAEAPPTYSQATETASTISETSSVQGTPRTSDLSIDTTAISVSAAAAAAAAVSTWSDHEPPPGTQRAQAPLSVIKTNQKIQENFLVMLDSEHSSQEDVLLQTTNSKIHCGVWVDNDDAEWKEPVRIRAKTSNAKVRLDVPHVPISHTVDDEQHALAGHGEVDISVNTTNASIDTFLPPNFHGLVMLSTSNSTQFLSPSLQARSVRVPSGPEEKSKSVEWYEINGPNGRSRARLVSTNAKVKAGLVGDDDVGGCEGADGKCEDKCCVM